MARCSDIFLLFLFWISYVSCYHYANLRYARKNGAPALFSLGGKRSGMDNNVCNTQKNIARAIISICIACGGLPAIGNCAELPVFSEVWQAVKDNYYDATFNGVDWSDARQKFERRIKDGYGENAATKEMLSLLGDKYTRLLSKRTYADLWKYDAIGVGLLLQSDPVKGVFVSAPPVAGSSAAQAGLLVGDKILTIDGVSTEGLTAMQLLDQLSNSAHTTISVEYSRPSSSAKSGDTASSAEVQSNIVVLTRSIDKAAKSVSYASQRLSDGILAGYIRLSEFNSDSVAEMKQALTDLNAQGIDELALDLRGNTGGGFQFALNIGGMFMQDKEMVTAVGNQGKDTYSFKTSFPEGVLYSKPLVVITDGLSASASEVLAVGLRDNCRAAIVGAQTFGKGKMQAVFGLSTGEGLAMTVAEYRSPKGSTIQSVGIKPDLAIKVGNPYVSALFRVLRQDKPNLQTVEFPRAQQVLRDSCSAI